MKVDIDDFTMVIPTYCRPRMLRTLLELYSGQGLHFRMIVADSGRDEIKAENSREIARYGSRIQHVLFDSQADPILKFHAIPDLIETPYAMYAADDDVVILSGLVASLDFLRAHSDYVACHGTYYSTQYADPETLRLETAYAVVSHDLPDPFARVLSLCMRYQALTYSVMRRETFVRTRIPTTLRAAAHFSEIFHSFAMLVEGKIAGLAVPFAVRNAIEGDISPSVLDRDPAVWIAKDSASFWRDGYLPFRAALAAVLAPSVGIDAAPHLVDIAYATFFARMFNFDLSLSILAETGRIDADAVAMLRRLRTLANHGQPPTPEVLGVVKHLAERGWPAYA